MIKKALVFMFLLIPMTVHADALIEEFEDFAVAESSDSDITMKMVELNDGADPVAVGGFDIAGIMLGMPFEDIQALFYKSKGLYVPRKNNS